VVAKKTQGKNIVFFWVLCAKLGSLIYGSFILIALFFFSFIFEKRNGEKPSKQSSVTLFKLCMTFVFIFVFSLLSLLLCFCGNHF